MTNPKLTSESSHRSRLLTAAIGIPLVLAVVWLGGWAFILVVSVLALLGLRELELAHHQAGVPLIRSIAYPALLMLLVFAAASTSPGATWRFYATTPFFSLWILPLSLLTLAVLAYGGRHQISLASLAMTHFAVFYVGLFVFLVLLRALPQNGLSLFGIVLLGVWTGDSLAYFGGRKWGKTPLTVLSPKKTKEGSAIGASASLLLCVALATWWGLSISHGLVLGVLIAIATPLGDLAESFWKRELEIKDLGSLLPGHGGVLDRCDSLLFASCAVYLFETWKALY